MKLTKYLEDDRGVVFISEPHDIGGLIGVLFFLNIENTAYFSQEWEDECGKFHVEVGCVCENQTPQHGIDNIINQLGIGIDEWSKTKPSIRACELMRGGFAATFWQSNGNNRRDLEREGRQQLRFANTPLAFDQMMKQAQNKIGASGYDFIRGYFLGPLEGKTMKAIVQHAIEHP